MTTMTAAASVVVRGAGRGRGSAVSSGSGVCLANRRLLYRRNSFVPLNRRPRRRPRQQRHCPRLLAPPSFNAQGRFLISARCRSSSSFCVKLFSSSTPHQGGRPTDKALFTRVSPVLEVTTSNARMLTATLTCSSFQSRRLTSSSSLKT